MENDKKILEVKDLTVRFGERKVVDGVSFDLYAGEVLAIVGESGSGKTLTALSILDLLPGKAVRDKGEILFDGMNVFEMDKDTLRKTRGSGIAMVFQEPFTALNPVLKIGQQLLECFEAHGIQVSSYRGAKITGLLNMVGLPENIVFSYPHELSGGMRQRVMLGIGLSCSPSVLILDEPTTALDVSIQKNILELIKGIQAENNISIIFITHDLSIVNNFSDRICVMRSGKIVEDGDREKVLATPSHKYTKALIECIPRLGDTRRRLPEIG